MNTSKACTFLVDYRIDKNIESSLIKNEINYIKTLKHENLYSEIDGHADIIACNIGDITVIEPHTYNLMYDKLKTYNIQKGKSVINSKYPYDIAYNFVITDNYVIGNIDYIDESIKDIALKKNLKFIKINQGYARCSIIPLAGDIFITSDIGIYKSLKSQNLKVYHIEIDDIFLSDRYNGFLGGACGIVDNEIIFFGNIKMHKAYESFVKIAKEQSISYKNLYDCHLRDYGSMIPLYNL